MIIAAPEITNHVNYKIVSSQKIRLPIKCQNHPRKKTN